MADDQPDMAWMRLTADHDHRLHPQGTIAFLKGMRVSITRAGFAIAHALGRAEEIPPPNRATAQALKADPFADDVPEPATGAPPPPPSPQAAPAAPPAAAATPQGQPPAPAASEAPKGQE